MKVEENNYSSLLNLLRVEGFKNEIFTYAKSRNLSLQEVWSSLEKAVNQAFIESEIEILKNLRVEYKESHFKVLNEKDRVVNAADIQLDNVFNHAKFHIERSIFRTLKELQIEKLKESVQFSRALYEIEIMRIGNNFIIGEIIDHHGAEVWIDEFDLIRKDRIKIGDRMKVILKDELTESKGESRYMGTRRGTDFIKLVLEEIVPEIEERSVQISFIAREEGVKTYVVVESTNLFVNAVRSVIGPSASRINEIKKHLPERLEILDFKPGLENMIREIFGENLIEILEGRSEEESKLKLKKIDSSSFPRLEIKILKFFYPKINWIWEFLEQSREEER